jgi:surface polysaccharide O-acyltransferase-like enzyme
VKKTSASLSKVAGILGLMWFYGFLFYALAVAARWIHFDFRELGKVALPFLVHDRWFVETYLLLYLLSPFINTALVRLGRREFRILLLVMFIFFSAWPSVLPGGPVTDSGYGIATFVLLYSVGAYVRLWGFAPRPKRLYLAGYLLCASATFACSVSLTDTLGQDRIWGYNFVPNLLGSACLFMMFDGIRLQRQYINQIAAHTFAVFLIHTDHSLSGIIYEDVLRTATFRSSPLFLVHAAASIALIYVGATAVDVVRRILTSAIARRLARLAGSRTPSRWQGIP